MKEMMNAFYFDYKILSGENVSEAESRLRRSLQRRLSAKETLSELNARRGLYGVGGVTGGKKAEQRA